MDCETHNRFMPYAWSAAPTMAQCSMHRLSTPQRLHSPCMVHCLTTASFLMHGCMQQFAGVCIMPAALLGCHDSTSHLQALPTPLGCHDSTSDMQMHARGCASAWCCTVFPGCQDKVLRFACSTVLLGCHDITSELQVHM